LKTKQTDENGKANQQKQRNFTQSNNKLPYNWYSIKLKSS